MPSAGHQRAFHARRSACSMPVIGPTGVRLRALSPSARSTFRSPSAASDRSRASPSSTSSSSPSASRNGTPRRMALVNAKELSIRRTTATSSVLLRCGARLADLVRRRPARVSRSPLGKAPLRRRPMVSACCRYNPSPRSFARRASASHRRRDVLRRSPVASLADHLSLVESSLLSPRPPSPGEPRCGGAGAHSESVTTDVDRPDVDRPDLHFPLAERTTAAAANASSGDS